ncbi:MAG: diaminopimelate decarboxylase [Oscillospiraceae bacterium]|nr:diaminopimelate decarboxylase [Oscillospiraceae bacterium]
MKSKDLICENLSVGENGRLLFAGHDTELLAKKYGTPVYLLDEDRIRQRCRTYLQAMKKAFGCKGKVLYASKAASFKRIYEIMNEEGMGIDVVSSGEIYTVLRAGYPLQNAYFHSNNKTDEDVSFAMENGIGYFVVDNEEELFAIQTEAERRNINQKILLRITPGIDPHTYMAVSTGKVDSKFGSAIETGAAEKITRLSLEQKNISLMGFHCHVGSQVFDSEVYLRAADVMLSFIADIKAKTGYEAKELDLGGGYGVRYVSEQPVIDIAENILSVGDFIKEKCMSLGILLPYIALEPGRSIVADAGLTLYTVGSVKKIPGYKNYVSVDGGMTDNVRFAMYGSPYTILPALDMNLPREMRCSVVGRCCESGDIIQNNVPLPDSIKRGDILACLTTGAYHYSMASNYNRIPRPPIVMLSANGNYIAVKRETFEDLTHLEV